MLPQENTLSNIPNDARLLNSARSASVIQKAIAHYRDRSGRIVPTKEEIEWLEDIKLFVTNPARSLELVAWSRALRAYGTPLDFVRHIISHNETVSIHGQEITVSGSTNKGHELRRDLILAQHPYAYKQNVLKYPFPLRLGDGHSCKLCENIAQTHDSFVNPEVPSNMILDLGDSIVMPNRYPAVPGHSLWMLKSHDDESYRVSIRDPAKPTFHLPPQPGLTRGNILSAANLATVFDLASTLGFIAARNHTLDGMSVPGHDHFHLLSEHGFARDHFKILLGTAAAKKAPFIITDLDTVPYSLLVVKGNSPRHTASIVAPIAKSLEDQNYVFTMAYLRGVAILSPRDPDSMSAHARIDLGAAPNLASFKHAASVEMANIYLPRRNSFDWSAVLTLANAGYAAFPAHSNAPTYGVRFN